MTQSRRRLQIRVTLDSDMGALFEWASAIEERARARELVGMLRVGFAVSTGNAALAARAETAMGNSRPSASRGERTGSSKVPDSDASLELQGADATLLVFDPASVIGVPPP